MNDRLLKRMILEAIQEVLNEGEGRYEKMGYHGRSEEHTSELQSH